MKKFFKGIKGRQVLVSGLAVLVLVAGYYRWTIDKAGEIMPVVNDTLPQDSETKEGAGDIAKVDDKNDQSDYFARARYERDCARSEATELLKVSAQNDTQGESGNLASAEKIAEYAKNIEDEATIESLVMSKGYNDCVAFVDDSEVRVVVKSDKLEKGSVSQIKDIIIQQTGVDATKIKISSKN